MIPIVLLMFFCFAVYFDWKEDKIPNLLCFTGMTVGGILEVWFYGKEVLLYLTEYSLLLFAVLLPLWIWGVIGGGDVKLFMMAAFFLGKQVFHLLVLAALCTAVYGIALLIYRGNLGERWSVFSDYLKSSLKQGDLARYPFDREKETDCRNGGIHVSYGILAGYIIGRITGIL